MGEANPTIKARIIETFDRFAGSYDANSDLQAEVAGKLFDFARGLDPRFILDIGCGTGHVALRASRLWPLARVTALDAAPGMLGVVHKKAPNLQIVQSDAADIRLGEKFDLIFSSMMLHWLDAPTRAVEQWRDLLGPNGRLFVAAPVQGSLAEWRRVCAQNDISDPTWAFPQEAFLEGLATSARIVEHPVSYPNLLAFLESMKKTGATTSNPEAPRITTAALRRAIRENDGAFVSTFRVLYAEVAPRS
jgi:malonyl-CoA O-methyltransferase